MSMVSLLLLSPSSISHCTYFFIFHEKAYLQVADDTRKNVSYETRGEKNM